MKETECMYTASFCRVGTQSVITVQYRLVG